MKMLYCKKCGAAVISDETLLQSILDRLDDVQERALHAKSGSEKQILLHEAAEYKTMYKSMMHNITQREYAEAVVPYILREMLITVKGRKLLTDAEVEKIYADGKAAAKKVQDHTRKVEKKRSTEISKRPATVPSVTRQPTPRLRRQTGSPSGRGHRYGGRRNDGKLHE